MQNANVRETAAEMNTLQRLIDESHARVKPHMRGIIHPGKYSLTAGQVVRLFAGMRTIAVAAPAPNGDPLVGPMDGWFLHGKVFWSSGGDAIRVKGLRTRPRASVVYFEGERFAIIAHGHAELMYEGHPDVGEIDAIFRDHYESSAFDWSEHGVYVRLDADRFYTYSRSPEGFPG